MTEFRLIMGAGVLSSSYDSIGCFLGVRLSVGAGAASCSVGVTCTLLGSPKPSATILKYSPSAPSSPHTQPCGFFCFFTGDGVKSWCRSGEVMGLSCSEPYSEGEYSPELFAELSKTVCSGAKGTFGGRGGASEVLVVGVP